MSTAPNYSQHKGRRIEGMVTVSVISCLREIGWKNVKTEEEILAETEERRKRSQRLTGDTADPAEAERVSKRREELYGIVTGPDGMKATSVTTSSTWVTSIAVPAFVLVLAMTFGLYREMAKLGMLPDVLPAALVGGQQLQ